MSAPIVRRYHRHECTRCGRPLNRQPRPNTRQCRIIRGTIPTDTLWCIRCAARSRARGLIHAGQRPSMLTPAHYRRALIEWANAT